MCLWNLAAGIKVLLSHSPKIFDMQNQDSHSVPDSGSTIAITTRITNRSWQKYQSHLYPPSSGNNLINIQCSDRLTADRCKQQVVACNINVQSVSNKSTVIFYYICDHTSAIVTLTEYWVTDLDTSVRAELCPSGYKILDHTRSDRRGQGTGIIYHESLDVKKIDAGVSVRYSHEFSEWIVKSGGYSIRIAIIYRRRQLSPHNYLHLSVSLIAISYLLTNLWLTQM